MEEKITKMGILNTAIFSFNKGDYIIMESAKEQLKEIVQNKFTVEIATHAPLLHSYQFDKKMKKDLDELQVKFVCGTNLLSKSLFRRRTSWNINIFESHYLKNCVLLGVGAGNIGKFDFYTQKVLKKVLAKDYIHSVRDEEAKVMLESIGLQAINTGCPTLWNLNKEHCQQIDTEKRGKVVFTLTDYKKDIVKDQMLINILKANYKEIYFWVQGFKDFEYFRELENIEDIHILYPEVSQYESFLENNECDYVGTRLHAGIKAMQKKRRSIIIIVDNRARSMKKDYQLNCIERDEIEEKLESYIQSEIITDITLKQENINKWKQQFLNKE